jgi:hypothetical protein
MESKHKLLLVVWALDSVALVGLFIYIFLHGSTPDTNQWAGYLGAIWGGAATFLIVPVWRAIKRWPAPHRNFLLFSVLISLIILGGLISIRARQMARLETLFKEAQALGVKGAPQKQLFMKLSRENSQDLPDYLQRCAELEPVVNDYTASLQQMDSVLAQMQQAIGELKPKGRYGNMLPMIGVLRAIMSKDLEGAAAYKQEIAFAKQLPSIPEAERVQFYRENIDPVVEHEQRVAQDELEIMKAAQAQGIALPNKMLQDAGIK